MGTVHAAQAQHPEPLHEALTRASKRIEITPDGEAVYMHLMGTHIGKEPDDDPLLIKEVPIAYLHAEVMHVIDKLIGELRANEGCEQLGPLAMSAVVDGPTLPIDTEIRITMRFEAMRSIGEHIYRFDVMEVHGTDIYYRGTFVLR